MIIAVMRKGEQMRLIDVSELKEWIKNWLTKNRLYHPYAKNNNIPITELYDILEQMPSAQPECEDAVSRSRFDERVSDGTSRGV